MTGTHITNPLEEQKRRKSTSATSFHFKAPKTPSVAIRRHAVYVEKYFEK